MQDRRSSTNEPGPEAVGPSTPPGGLSTDRRRSERRRREIREDTVNRRAPNLTPRRYEQPLEADDDPVLPAGDATLNTKL